MNDGKIMKVIPSCRYAVDLENDLGWSADGICEKDRKKCVGTTCKFYKRKQ